MHKTFWSVVVAGALAAPLSALAAPDIVLGTDTIAAGESASINMTFEADGVVAGLDYKFTFDNTEFTATPACVPTIPTTNGSFNATVVCSVVGDTVSVLVSAPIANPVPPIAGGSVPLGTVSFQSQVSTAAGDYDLTITDSNFFNASGAPVAGSGNTDGRITVVGAEYTSTPTPGSTINQSVVQNDTDPQDNIQITNTGADGTTLSGTCSLGGGSDAVFGLSGDTSFSVLKGDPADTVTVTCDSAGSVGPHTGSVECTHNGTNIATPATYNLSCDIQAAPEPIYSSAPTPGSVINMSATYQGDPISDETVDITNTGPVGTTLIGSCGLSGNSEISLTGGGYNLASGATSMQTISCDSSAEGNYSATLSCSHNATNTGDPATYTVNCDVGPLRPAVFDSTPASGGSTNLTPDPVAQNSTPPTALLTVRNTATAPAQGMPILCSMGGANPTVITASPAIDTNIAAGGSAQTTFSCDTSADIGTYSAQYTCNYYEDSEGVEQQATWDLSCELRAPKSVVEPQTPGGTTVTQFVSEGGSALFDLAFDETANEGVDGDVDCSLADGTNFTLLTSMPATVPAGGSVVVSVQGTDPQDDSTSVTDTLNCTYRDTDHPEVGVQVSYPLELQIGGNVANFRVTKAYSDGNTDEVEVTLTCNNGLPLEQSLMISEGHPVNFVVHDFTEGQMDCTVTETGTADGYTPSYYNGSVYSDTDCSYTDVVADQYICEISNAAGPATYTVTKEWIIDNASADAVDLTADVHISCDSPILGVSGVKKLPEEQIVVTKDAWITLEGETDSAEVTVDTTNGTAHCSAEEDITQSGVESERDAGCTNATLVAGGSATCTITNTVFFEGIPTLSQWGLAILAILTLGVGLVGFRRFT